MIQFDFTGRVAVVTGGARGIGLAVVKKLMAAGASCSIWDINEADLERRRSELDQAKLHTITVDLTDVAAVHNAAESVQARFGRLDILVNNAAIAGPTAKLWECNPADWRKAIDVDLVNVFNCCHAVVPLMLANKYGRIISMASIAGKEGNPNASAYSAAKAGVIGLTKSLGKELAQSGITVHAIAPAVIETEMLQQTTQEHINYMVSKIPMGRMGQVEEVANLICWLASEEYSFSTAAVHDISGGRATY
ncbi:MAG TPA: SDR family NAD(P)-dependent oxidoreductase [Methylomirabilota bacterium]|nr:SDR family NAD(P)-dependent oxidoreductase [Methylomirabilota bacterium]